MRVNDLIHVFGRHMSIPHRLGINDDSRPQLALIEASRLVHPQNALCAPQRKLRFEHAVQLRFSGGIAAAARVPCFALIRADENVLIEFRHDSGFYQHSSVVCFMRRAFRDTLFVRVTTSFQPRIVGIGGTLRPGSSSEKALRYALSRAQARGARVELFTGEAINLPAYIPEAPAQTPEVLRLVEALRGAHGALISSPGYHGSVSGLVKNAVDYAEGLRDDAQPYLEGRALGLIACAQGWQAANSTLVALRSIAHALRGWPTPLGIAFNTSAPAFGDTDEPLDAAFARQLDVV